MDFEKWLEQFGMKKDDLSDAQISSLKKVYDSHTKLEGEVNTSKQKLTDLEKDVEFQKSEAKKAFAKRDELKTEIKNLEKQVADGAKNIDFKELFDEQKQKATELADKVTSAETELNDIKGKYTKADEENKSIKADISKSLIEKLPEGSDARTFAEKMKDDLPTLREYVEIQEKSGIFVDDNSTKKLKIDVNKKFNDYTFAELTEMKKTNSTHYEKLKNEQEADYEK
jgi:chromosome segregation ATPase